MITLWLLGLAAVFGSGYWLRRSRHRSVGRKLVESERREAAKRRLEQDRLACRELEASLAGRFDSGGGASAEPLAALAAAPSTQLPSADS